MQERNRNVEVRLKKYRIVIKTRYAKMLIIPVLIYIN